MTDSPQFRLEKQAASYGLAIEYSDQLPDKVAGLLDRDVPASYILVNCKLPHCEQLFTIAHELAHYILHHNRLHPAYVTPLWRRRWQSPHLALLFRGTRYITARILSNELMADWGAIQWLAGIWTYDDCKAFFRLHPEKLAPFLLFSALQMPRLATLSLKALLRQCSMP